jgi:hypothetical protein
MSDNRLPEYLEQMRQAGSDARRPMWRESRMALMKRARRICH